MKYQISFFIVALLLLLPWSAQGQSGAKEEPAIPTIKIVLHPMPESRPALKYQLLPPLIDRIPGNAAVIYNKSTAEATNFFGDKKLWDKIDALLEAPLTEMRNKEARKTANEGGWLIKNFIRAGRCEDCDWQLPIRQEEYLSILLEEVQQSRSYAWLLAAKARLQIADGQYDKAVITFQAGYALGRNVARGQTLINGLVGATIAGVMSNQVREFIQQPDAPNLYWALTTLPRPIIDIRAGIEAEQDCFYLSFPELQHLETKDLAPDQWRLLFNQTIQKITPLGSGGSLTPEQASIFSTAMLLERYPRAKTFLIERGWPADKVEAMPVCQVVLLAGLRQYEEIRDNVFKWLYPPYAEVESGMNKANVQLREFCASRQEFIPIGSKLLPSIIPAKRVEARIDRLIASLRILEAIRLYGAAHDGRLPEKLADITDVPIPLDPIHGTAFIYHCSGKTAILESPAPPGLSPESYWLRYEITLESKGK